MSGILDGFLNMANMAPPGPWVKLGTGQRAFEITASNLAAQFGGQIPALVDLYVTLNKPSLSVTDGDTVSVFQIHTDSTQSMGSGRQLAGPAFIAYGSTVKFPGVTLDPDQAGLDLFTGSNTAATLRVALPETKPAEVGGLQTQSAADKLTDAAVKAVPDAAGMAISTIGIVVVVVVLIIAFYVGGIPRPKKA